MTFWPSLRTIHSIMTTVSIDDPELLCFGLGSVTARSCPMVLFLQSHMRAFALTQSGVVCQSPMRSSAAIEMADERSKQESAPFAIYHLSTVAQNPVGWRLIACFVWTRVRSRPGRSGPLSRRPGAFWRTAREQTKVSRGQSRIWSGEEAGRLPYYAIGSCIWKQWTVSKRTIR
ncbi:hypothetical protein M011DRAFT_295035 [Sporormia fimetaria CBS 119925]|uniref:Uncharacterized protein n=1 Tax=Sporormia fimetaria CBS 119925 TaxID=1340428 RepID=A0A6A6UYM1_9PLEO|nr:hypothetical protein M011DRAFT_295035 [Sporormia fimetaria CBS 119925]